MTVMIISFQNKSFQLIYGCVTYTTIFCIVALTFLLMQTYNEFKITLTLTLTLTDFNFIPPPILVITYIFSRTNLMQTFNNLVDSCLAASLMTTAQKQI